MSPNKTKFTAPKKYDQGIIRLINDICKNTGLSRETIKRHSQNAINTWEIATDQKINNLFAEDPKVIQNTIPRILYYFESEFWPVIHDKKVMEQTLEIAKLNLEYMYRLK